MILKEGYFFDNEWTVRYTIEENIIDGRIKLNFRTIDSVINYYKRNQSYKLEVMALEKVITPKERDLDFYVNNIQEFYNSTSSPEFVKVNSNVYIGSCDIVLEYEKYTYIGSDGLKRYLLEEANFRGIPFEDVLKQLDYKKRNGYR